MNLRTLIEKSLTILRSKVIGCEFYVGEEKVLLLGLQTLVDNSIYYDNDDEEIINEAKTCIYLLYKSEPDETEYDEDGNSYEKKEETCINHVQYEVDGKTYKDKLSLVSCNYDIGDEVGIYYDVDNPAIMEEKNNKYL